VAGPDREPGGGAEGEGGSAGLACFREPPMDIIRTACTVPGLTGGEVFPPQRSAVAVSIEPPCGLTLLHTGIRLRTKTTGDRSPCGPPLAGA
jgi:hypothetical protein